MTRADKIEFILELDANFPSPGAFWDACKGQFLEEAQEAQHTAKRRKRSTAERRLKQALSTLAKTPDNDHATEEYAHALVEVAELDSYTVQRALTLAHVQWIEEGERPSPHLTAWLRGAIANHTVPALRWNNNSPPTTDPEEMANIATSFYRTLYTVEPTDATAQTNSSPRYRPTSQCQPLSDLALTGTFSPRTWSWRSMLWPSVQRRVPMASLMPSTKPSGRNWLLSSPTFSMPSR
ncbi:hypothetical protein DFQ27_002142 [Actinomortierella ambigua]|uniref:Uncharacterized protein n=1 Tax=Actinomortierella ambigua TaxID=1343610 RepID=A0A9P6U7M7_9FUNG|nr:hypothetical protein DFQ27_002142 [Actinomortierella ambigua]